MKEVFVLCNTVRLDVSVITFERVELLPCGTLNKLTRLCLPLSRVVGGDESEPEAGDVGALAHIVASSGEL